MADNIQKIRIGIVGAGANTRAKHIPGLQTIEGVEIVSVSNRRKESSENVSRQYGIPRVYDSWEELVNAPDSDAIVIGTWPYMHCPITLAALSAGKHVLCEARMAMDASEAHFMRTAAQNHPELITQIVPSPLTLRFDNTVRRLLAERFLGDLLAVEVRGLNGQFIDPQAPMHWRQDAQLSGINVMSLGIWYESLMRWIGEAANATAKGKIFVKKRHDPLSGCEKEVKIPDHLAVSADMACGAQASFFLSSVCGHEVSQRATLFGTEGTIRIDVKEDVLSGAGRAEKELSEMPVTAQEAGAWRVEEEFIGAIRGTEKTKYTTFHDGVKYMEFTEAVALSLESGKTEIVPPLI